MFFSRSSIIFMPLFFASCILWLCTAGTVPFPGSASPIASDRQFMLLAVYMPEHEPHPGHELFSNSASSASSIRFAFLAPAASNSTERLTSLSPTLPASIGPPLATIEGILILAAPIIIPGTILSQFGTRTRASKQ